MSLTRAELSLTLDEARAALVGGRIERVDDPGRDAVALTVHAARLDHHFLVSARAGFSRAHLLSERSPRAPEPGAFVMLLRKRIVGARIETLELWGDDRVVRLGVRSKEGASTLLCELTGRHANVFLVEGEGDVIVASLRPNLSHKRALVPGAVYVYPLESEVAAQAMAQSPRLSASSPGAEAEALFAELEARAGVATLAAESARILRETRKRLVRRAQAIAADRARAEGAAPYHHYGTLLVSQLHLVRRGMTEVRVQDWSVDPPAEVALPLDPALSPKANVERLFARYRKFKEGLAQVAAQEERLAAEERRLDELDARFAAAVAEGERSPFAPRRLQALRAELVSRGLLRAPQAAPRRRGADREAPREPFRRFTSRDGQAILVGRGPADNDRLTFKHARGNDLWLHARDYPGAHVVVPLGRDEAPPSETLLDAATLAAHYSPAKDSAVVDVAVTRCKHVRKQKGGAPGLVTMSESRTVAVRMEPERIERLFRKQDLD